MEFYNVPNYEKMYSFVPNSAILLIPVRADEKLNCKYALDFSIEINQLKTLLQVSAYSAQRSNNKHCSLVDLRKANNSF